MVISPMPMSAGGIASGAMTSIHSSFSHFCELTSSLAVASASGMQSKATRIFIQKVKVISRCAEATVVARFCHEPMAAVRLTRGTPICTMSKAIASHWRQASQPGQCGAAFQAGTRQAELEAAFRRAARENSTTTIAIIRMGSDNISALTGSLVALKSAKISSE